MAEWQVEESFGESRALLIENDRVLAARLGWRTSICAGAIVMAKVISRRPSSSRGLCRTADGFEVNVPDLPREATEGSDVRLIIHREPMAEKGRLKRAQGRHFHDQAPPLPSTSVLDLGKHVHRLPQGMWEEVWSAASDGELPFPNGKLLLSVTPAMSLIDIDGHGSPKELALAAIPAILQAIHWFDLGGSIGIDFPTLEAKVDRKAIDSALAQALDDWPHERTAMNGFGFVQIVARMEMPSLLHRFTYSRPDACARFLLRQAQLVKEPGALLLTCHPAVRHAIPDDWLIELAESTGRGLDDVRFETRRALALDAGFAQAVAR
ncbi:ribonuclease [Erythrobacter alti]|uniref:ribonuclease n=1 Tax=Erythrobacter alti TaxID=1896145 RepID=UPI0030F3D267